MKAVRKIDNHDTRGRKIVSADYAKKALIIIYAFVVSIAIIFRGFLVESYKISIENYLISGIRLGLISGILFFISWVVTFKVGMNKFAIREVEKTKIKATAQYILGNWLANNKYYMKECTNLILAILATPLAYMIYLKRYKNH